MTPQQSRILDYLKEHGSITKLEGPPKCSVLNVSDCVMSLRRKGWRIETEWIKGKNKYGDYKYANYVLKSKRRRNERRAANTSAK